MINSYIAVGAMNIIALLLILFMASQNEMFSVRTKRYYWVITMLIIAEIVSEIVTDLADNGCFESIIPNIVANTIGFSISPLIPTIMAMLFDKRMYKIRYVLFGVTALNMIAVCLSPLTGWIFSVNPGNEYTRGSQFWIFILSYTFGIIILFLVMLRSLKSGKGTKQRIIPCIFAFTAIGTTIQLIFLDIHTTWLCVTFSVVIYYAMLCENNNKLDTLTGMYNRRVYELARVHLKMHSRGIVVVLDINDFKSVNDTGGHNYGDYCLAKYGEEIRVNFNGVGIGYRTGGDEFCVICEKSSEKVIRPIINQLIKDIEKERILDARFPTFSYGFCEYIVDENGLDWALTAADERMYKFKNITKMEHKWNSERYR